MSSKLTQDHFLIGFLALVVLASAGDMSSDLAHGADLGHLLQEAVLLSAALIILVLILRELRSKKRELRELHTTLENIRNLPQPDSAQLSSARSQLSEAITEQFTQWQLSKSEEEVGMMLLKGYSLKEISLLRGTSEKTIRQQASGIYHKSGLPGRHALSAWFIEDML